MLQFVLTRMRHCYLSATLLLALLAVVPSPAHAASQGSREELLIGWRGETYLPADKVAAGDAASALNNATSKARRQFVETISWSPRAFVHHGFLTHAECDHMIALVNASMERSGVIDAKTGKAGVDPIRTSFGGVIGRGADPLIASIEQRIADWTHIPASHGEAFQVLRYNDGQKYDAHWDWFDDPSHPHKPGTDNRMATVLLYLSEVEEGGETALPLAEAIDEAAQRQEGLSPCATKNGIAVKPVKGDALLFFDMEPNGRDVSRASMHASCPTLKGTKYTATKWIHSKPYGAAEQAVADRAACCEDRDGAARCAAAAAAGKCNSDAGLTGLLGGCRRTCGDCQPCAKGDLICMRKNLRSRRAKVGGSHPI